MTRIRHILTELKTSFADGGIEAMHQTHLSAIRSSLRYSCLCNLVDLAYPATTVLDIAKSIDRHMGELGIADGSKAALNTLPITWQAEFPRGGRAKIGTGSVVVFGRHGSILTPFFVAAALDRLDLKMLGASYVAKLGPNVANAMYPVIMPKPTFRGAGRKGIVPRISGWLTSRLESTVEKDIAKEQNRASLARSVEHVRNGGALLVAPDTCDPNVKWRHGIGHLIAHIAKISEPECDTHLVPYRIWAPITSIFRLFSRNPILRAVGKWQYRHPVRVVLEEPIALSTVIEQTGLDPAAITEYLQTSYRDLGF